MEFRPDLSVAVDPQGVSEAVRFEIPDRIAASRGRPADTQPELTTEPHVSGIDGPPPPPDDAVLQPPEGYEDLVDPPDSVD